jgi:uncharacterized protein (TIGR01440 family)
MDQGSQSTDISLHEQVAHVVREIAEAAHLGPGKLLVVGASTSEVVGSHIGTDGALEIANELLLGIEEVREEMGFHVVFQCCEHLNRSLVMERTLLEELHLTEVAAVPYPKAGGSMASVAYRKLLHPCLAESVEAHAGIDIGETMIGMHLLRVAVPFRPSIRYIGQARVNAAYTRPKLIGGERAHYQLEETASVQQSDSNLCD